MRDSLLVSILTNNFNYAPFLRDSIESALNQSYPNIEVIVVDDGSTDNSREIVASYGERVIPVFQENAGQGSAFNAGFVASRGEIICFLDADDVFLPNKVQRMVDVLDRFPEAGWIRHKLTVTDEKLRSLGSAGPSFHGSRLTRPKPNTYLEDKVRFVISSGIAVRRSTAETFLPMPEAHVPQWPFNADAYVGFWSAVAGACYSVDEPLAYYRRQGHQRFRGSADVVRWLEGQIRLEERLSEMWSAHTGTQKGPRRTCTSTR